jgi:single-strand selective monofunctional uracil DNA glycosylase
VLGFDCPRGEVSGRRLWGLFAQRFGAPEKFFREHFVLNYCPLVFMEESGRNLTPDKLPRGDAAPLFAACDEHLRRAVELLEPEWLVGVGGFAHERVQALAGRHPQLRSVQILHPSPASPAANRDWAGLVTAQLQQCGAWKRS